MAIINKIPKKLLDEAVVYQTSLLKYEQGVIERVMQVMQAADAELTSKLLGYSGKGSYTSAWLKQSAEDVKAAVYAGNQKTYDALVGELQQLAQIVAEKEIKVMGSGLGQGPAADAQGIPKKTLDMLKVEGDRYVFNFTRPSTDQMVALVETAPIQGGLLKDWFATLGGEKQHLLNRNIRMAAAEGNTIEEMVQRLAGTKAGGYKDGILNITRRNAEAVMRTAVNNVSNQAAHLTMQANTDLVTGWTFVATLDGRTTVTCATLSGTNWPLGDGPVPPRHIRCRSFQVPKIKTWEELGVPIKEIPPGSRASASGEVDANITFSKWLEGQPKDVQNEILGATRADLFRKGDLDLKNFANEYGQVYSLKELQAKYPFMQDIKLPSGASGAGGSTLAGQMDAPVFKAYKADGLNADAKLVKAADILASTKPLADTFDYGPITTAFPKGATTFVNKAKEAINAFEALGQQGVADVMGQYTNPIYLGKIKKALGVIGAPDDLMAGINDALSANSSVFKAQQAEMKLAKAAQAVNEALVEKNAAAEIQAAADYYKDAFYKTYTDTTYTGDSTLFTQSAAKLSADQLATIQAEAKTEANAYMAQLQEEYQTKLTLSMRGKFIQDFPDVEAAVVKAFGPGYPHALEEGVKLTLKFSPAKVDQQALLADLQKKFGKSAGSWKNLVNKVLNAFESGGDMGVTELLQDYNPPYIAKIKQAVSLVPKVPADLIGGINDAQSFSKAMAAEAKYAAKTEAAALPKAPATDPAYHVKLNLSKFKSEMENVSAGSAIMPQTAFDLFQMVEQGDITEFFDNMGLQDLSPIYDKVKKAFLDAGGTNAQWVKGITNPEKVSISTVHTATPIPTVVTPPPTVTAPVADKLRIDQFDKVGGKLGSNPGGTYVNKLTGEQWYIKTPGDINMAQNEVVAASLYRAAGVDVADLKLIDMGGGQWGLGSKWIDGLDSNAALLKAGKVAGAYEGFAVDAWLANWDVIGMDYDNLKVLNSVKAVRVDPGGALFYRAQGGLKDAFSGTVDEIQTLLDPKLNKNSAAVFAKIKTAQIEEGVYRVLSLKESVIREAVNSVGELWPQAKRDELIKILLQRQANLAEQFPELMAKKGTATEVISQKEFDGIVKGRANGMAIRIDNDQIEDQQILWHVEKHKSGADNVVGTFKVRETGTNIMNKWVDKALGIQPGAEKIWTLGFDQSQADLVHDKILEAWKGIMAPFKTANNSTLRAVDIERAKTALSVYDHAPAAIKTFYKEWAGDLKFLVQYGEGVGVTKDQLTTAILKKFETPFTVKEPAKVESVGIEFVKKKGVYQRSEFVNGNIRRGTVEESMAIGKDNNFFEADVDGVKVRYWRKGADDVAYSLQGQIQILTEGSSPDAISKAIQSLEKLGLNVAPPTAVQAEEMYLNKIAYTLNNSRGPNSYKTKLNSINKLATPEERVAKWKEMLSKDLGYDITKVPGYNPAGQLEKWEQGQITFRRPDMEGPEWESFMQTHVVIHQQWHGNGYPDMLDRVLNNGGKLASGSDRLRRGLPWGTTSPGEDFRSGGADYVFTRLKDAGFSDNGIVWKPDNHLRRLDAISYAGDKFGRVVSESGSEDYVTKTRIHSTAQSFKATAKDYSSNETNFKNGISIFDDVLRINIPRDEYDQVIAVFRKHGWNKWPDGRDLLDVIKKVN
jgi:SPP1 gp7 family putative phage head morphogenesis protein